MIMLWMESCGVFPWAAKIARQVLPLIRSFSSILPMTGMTALVWLSFTQVALKRAAGCAGRAQLRALKRGHLGAFSVRRNWSRSLVPPEGFGKLRKVAAFWKNLAKIQQNPGKICKIKFS